MAPKTVAQPTGPRGPAEVNLKLGEATEAEPNADPNPKSGTGKRALELYEEKEEEKSFIEVKKEELKEEDEQDILSWHDLIPMPKTALSGKKKFKADQIEARFVSYPWREESDSSDCNIMQLRSGDLLDALCAEPSAAEQALAEEIDIDASDTRLKQVDEIIQDLIEEQLKKEDLMGPKGDQRVQLAKHRRCPSDIHDFDVVDAAFGVKTEKEESEEMKHEFEEADIALADAANFPHVPQQVRPDRVGTSQPSKAMLPIKSEPSSGSSGCHAWPADIPFPDAHGLPDRGDNPNLEKSEIQALTQEVPLPGLPDMNDMPDDVDIPTLEMDDVPLPGNNDPLREESLPHGQRHAAVPPNEKPARPSVSLPSYRQLSVQRWQTCSELTTATVLLHACNVKQRAGRRYQRENAVHGNPHKRALNQVLFKQGVAWPKTQAGEMECVAPDLACVPDEVARVKAGEMIFTVAVCDKSGVKQQEFDILASQTLHDLRDAFYFVSDYTLDGQTRVESACMYIDGIFYSDLRSERSIDYAVPLIEHLRKAEEAGCEAPSLREHQSRSMGTRLRDIERIPFGERCIFIRQGDIEHHMYFTGLRRFNFFCDCPFEKEYPILIYLQQHSKRYCWACGQNQSIWIVRGSVRVPRDPLYICHLCFTHFFKNKEGELIKPVEYQVYPYFHD